VDPYSWSWNPEALAVVPLLTLAYVWAIRRTHEPTPPWRLACWAAAMALVWAVTITPVETISLGYLLSVHLIQNVVLAEWAPLLAVLAIPPALAARVPRVPAIPALLLWVVNYGVWHLPWIYDAALRHPHTLLHLEHALYFLTGLALWWPVVHGDLSSGAKAAYVFAAFVLASPIGLMMALVPEPIYAFYEEAPRLWGLEPLLDQQIAGVAMAAAESVVFFAAFAFFVVRFFREQDEAESERMSRT
jgi:cytochrome c oxidase assembly factor CtaG